MVLSATGGESYSRYPTNVPGAVRKNSISAISSTAYTGSFSLPRSTGAPWLRAVLVYLEQGVPEARSGVPRPYNSDMHLAKFSGYPGSLRRLFAV